MFIIGLLCWILILIAAFLTFDRLLFVEYSSYRKNWERDGKPHGFFWTPAELKGSGFWGFVRSSVAHKRLRFDWLFVTPPWIRESPEARLWLFAWRTLFFLAQAFVLAPIVVAIIYGEY